ncbi:MAG TPA: ABC transporter permease [Xanthobacteraceae bacterium]|nr:ABC transporter permease [Xanthobacteraceae bacterium]
MSTTRSVETMAEPWDELDAGPVLGRVPDVATSIVPAGSIAGRSLAAVVAIMTFLAALTTGAAMMVVGNANAWQSDVGREVTVQVRPAAARDIEADVNKAAALARAAAGVAEVRPYSKAESEKLVEPWLGAGLKLDDLPVPRLIVIKLAAGTRPDFADLRQALAKDVPTASLDDHRGWIERMRTMAETAVIAGLALLGLVVAVTVLSVTFATRGAMATNRPIVEVLHYVGATDAFIAGQFQRHFLLLGLKGGLIGGGAAIVLFGCAEAARVWLAGTPSGDEAAALFGTLSIGVEGYLAIVIEILVMAVVTAFVSRNTVNRTLETID